MENFNFFSKAPYKNCRNTCGTFRKTELSRARRKKWRERVETNTYLDADGGRAADKGGPAEEYLRGCGGCVVQRRLIRLCEGEPSAARLYKPARLCDSRTPSHPIVHVPTPGTLVPTPSPIRRQSILVQSNVSVYLGHGAPSCSCPRRLARTRISPRSADDEAAAGISGYGCIPQVLAPENFRARSRPLIDYLTAGDSPGKAPMRAPNGSHCATRGRSIFFRTRHYARWTKKVFSIYSVSFLLFARRKKKSRRVKR